jgi:hypothetical protein
LPGFANQKFTLPAVRHGFDLLLNEDGKPVFMISLLAEFWKRK